ncbi:MAG: hypothetical protein ABR861_00035 [Terriglobales bacterium]|jgi:uncharacterized protein YoxC
MDSIESKTTKPDGDNFCDKCGAETVRKNGFRDRQATEMEITESVAARLMKWAGWVRNTVGVIVALFALLLGWSYLDVRRAVENAKVEIDNAAADAKKDIDAVRRTTSGLKGEVAQIQSDIDGYKQVNAKIGQVQKELTEVKKSVVDFGKRDIKANSFMSTGPGPGRIQFGETGCFFSRDKDIKVYYCAQGTPPSLFQLTSTGDLRPVASRSPIGFQDASTAAKPTCTDTNRGTFYVEKGTGKLADKPFLCAKKADDSYGWIELAMLP